MCKPIIILSLLLVFVRCSNGNIEADKLKLELEKLKFEREKLALKKEKASDENAPGDKTAPNRDAVKTNVNQAKITGNNVLVRSDHSIQSNRKGVLKQGQIVTILDEFTPEGNQNEAILRSSTNFYNSYSGDLLFTLNKGKAIVIERFDGNMYNISYEDDRTGKTGYAQLSASQLEFISGDVWYKISTAAGVTGWVFGKFVSKG
ncbi:MAG: hypothetical protein ACK444_07005 [Flavobacteriales bacterium]|jgi:hypothetical protein